tara:strand:+ start:757 stop:1296 length:540 start_codon:yes stop_codon:yes gene_type:complete
MSSLEQRKTADSVKEHATNPEDTATQAQIHAQGGVTYITVTTKNLQEMRKKIADQCEASCEEKEMHKLSEKNWWNEIKLELDQDENLLFKNNSLIIVQEQKSSELIAFNLYTITAEKRCQLLFVHPSYRLRGIASAMLKQSGIQYAFALREALPFWKKWAAANNCGFKPGSSEMRPVHD